MYLCRKNNINLFYDMKAALFDLDGVIVDTEPAYGSFWSRIGREYGIGGEEFAKEIKGLTLTRILNDFIPNELKNEIVKALENFEKCMKYPLFDGALEFIKELNTAGIPCAIVTSSNNEKMDNLWRQYPSLKEHFDAVITDEDVTKSKPDPEPYIIAAKTLGVDPSDCWVFEDSMNGLLSGRRSGAKVIALATTIARELLFDKADAIYDSISDISLDSLE